MQHQFAKDFSAAMLESSRQPFIVHGKKSGKAKIELNLRIFLILNAIVGHLFAIKVLGAELRSFKFGLFAVFLVSCNLLMFGYSLIMLSHIYESLQELQTLDRKIEHLAFNFCGSFGAFLSLVRTCCLFAQDAKITELFKRAGMLVDERIIAAAARKCLIIVSVISLIFCSFMVAGAATAMNMKGILFNNR